MLAAACPAVLLPGTNCALLAAALQLLFSQVQNMCDAQLSDNYGCAMCDPHWVQCTYVACGIFCNQVIQTPELSCVDVMEQLSGLL
jgi:hypothetical protein